MKIKTILFDFFGVFSTPVYKTVIEKYIPQEETNTWMKKLDFLDTGELLEKDLVSELAQKASVTEGEIWEMVKNTPQVNYELFDFVEKNLKGNYKISLLTNIPRSLIERIIPDKLDFFDPLLISSDLKLIKPSKEIFELAIQRTNCSPHEILFIDDGERNIAAAKALGLHGIVYKDFQSFVSELKPYL